MEEVIQYVMSERRVRVDLQDLTQPRGIQVVQIPSGSLALCGLEEYLLEPPLRVHLFGAL